jgi:hypothetical protein
MLSKLQYLIHPFSTIAKIIDDGISRLKMETIQSDLFYKVERLNDKTLNSSEKGVSNEPISDKEVIVSLTSYGPRIYEVYLAIESIMQGTIKPNRIILWLSKDEFINQQIPITLQKQKKRGLEIEFCDELFSYKKIIPALKAFPNSNIITIDDDVIYSFDLIENLLNCHHKNLNCICASRIHTMTKNTDGSLKSYLQWDFEQGCKKELSHLFFFTGVGGIFYPPKSLDRNVFDSETFLKICRTADDVWLNAMARLQKTPIVKSYTHNPKGNDFIINSRIQDQGLCQINCDPKNPQNDVQIKAVFEKYKIKMS